MLGVEFDIALSPAPPSCFRFTSARSDDRALRMAAARQKGVAVGRRVRSVVAARCRFAVRRSDRIPEHGMRPTTAPIDGARLRRAVPGADLGGAGGLHPGHDATPATQSDHPGETASQRVEAGSAVELAPDGPREPRPFDELVDDRFKTAVPASYGDAGNARPRVGHAARAGYAPGNTLADFTRPTGGVVAI
jgi:hypothetical protein